MTTPDHTEIARQAARDAVASLLERRGHGDGVAAETRIGLHDDISVVKDAILGALAAADALLPLIRAEVVRECAWVALEEEARLRENAAKLWEMDCDNSAVVRERGQMAVTAGEIADSIFALIGEDSVSLSPLGRAAKALGDLHDDVAAAAALIPTPEDTST